MSRRTPFIWALLLFYAFAFCSCLGGVMSKGPKSNDSSSPPGSNPPPAPSGGVPPAGNTHGGNGTGSGSPEGRTEDSAPAPAYKPKEKPKEEKLTKMQELCEGKKPEPGTPTERGVTPPPPDTVIGWVRSVVQAFKKGPTSPELRTAKDGLNAWLQNTENRAKADYKDQLENGLRCAIHFHSGDPRRPKLDDATTQEVMERLLLHGASPLTLTGDDLNVPIIFKVIESGKPVLLQALLASAGDKLKDLLLQLAPKTEGKRVEKDTPLMLAIRLGNKDMVRILLDQMKGITDPADFFTNALKMENGANYTVLDIALEERDREQDGAKRAPRDEILGFLLTEMEAIHAKAPAAAPFKDMILGSKAARKPLQLMADRQDVGTFLRLKNLTGGETGEVYQLPAFKTALQKREKVDADRKHVASVERTARTTATEGVDTVKTAANDLVTAEERAQTTAQGNLDEVIRTQQALVDTAKSTRDAKKRIWDGVQTKYGTRPPAEKADERKEWDDAAAELRTAEEDLAAEESKLKDLRDGFKAGDRTETLPESVAAKATTARVEAAKAIQASTNTLSAKVEVFTGFLAAANEKAKTSEDTAELTGVRALVDEANTGFAQVKAGIQLAANLADYLKRETESDQVPKIKEAAQSLASLEALITRAREALDAALAAPKDTNLRQKAVDAVKALKDKVTELTGTIGALAPAGP